MTAPAQQSATALLLDLLRQWGLESLSDDVTQMLVNGDPPEIIPIKLQETAAYKQRFVANELRRKKGLPALSPAEYIENERQYRDRLRAAGLPTGFYDSPDDYRKWLENDVSPQEVEDRVSLAVQTYLQAPPQYRDQWERLYGLDAGHAVAAILDTERATPLIERQARAVTIAGEAQRAYRDGYQLDVNRAEELALAGVSAEDARRGFSEIAGRGENDQRLARLAGDDLTQTDLENEQLLGDQSAAMRRRRALDAERGRFDQNYLGAGQRSLSRDRSY